MPVHVPAAPPLIQLPAYVYGKTAEADPIPGAPAPLWKTQTNILAHLFISSDWTDSSYGGQLGNELVDGRLHSLSLSSLSLDVFLALELCLCNKKSIRL